MTREYLVADERKARIRDAAAELFASRGFHATSVEDICRAAGLSPGGLYRHYASKRHIVVAIVEDHSAAAAARVETAVATAGSDRAALAGALDALLDLLDDPPAAALQAEIVAESARSPQVASAATAYDERVRDIIRRVLTSAAAADSPAARDAAGAAELVQVVLDGIATRCAAHGSLDPGWRVLAHEVARTLIGGEDMP